MESIWLRLSTRLFNLQPQVIEFGPASLHAHIAAHIAAAAGTVCWFKQGDILMES